MELCGSAFCAICFMDSQNIIEPGPPRAADGPGAAERPFRQTYMPRRFWIFFAAVCAPLFSSAAISAEEISSAPAFARRFQAENFSSSLVTVTVNGLSVSGFAISEGLIATSAAVFSGYSSAAAPVVRIEALPSGRELHFRGIRAISFLSNLAVLKTRPAPELNAFLDLGGFSPEKMPGEIYIPQTSGGLLQKTRESVPQFVDGKVFYYFLSDAIAGESGQSGLPVISEEGAVIGVVSRAYGNLFQAVSVKELQKLLSLPLSQKPDSAIIRQKIIGLNKLAKKRHLEALYRLALISPAVRGGDRYLLAAASHGHVRAQLHWGLKLLYNDRGQEALSMLRWAARHGHPEAKTALAGMLYRGEGLSPDEIAAFKLYRDAARKGHVTAQTMMGVMLLNGHGVRQNPALARSWLMAAAEKGDSWAGHLLNRHQPAPRGRPFAQTPLDKPVTSSEDRERLIGRPNRHDRFVFVEVSFRGGSGGAAAEEARAKNPGGKNGGESSPEKEFPARLRSKDIKKGGGQKKAAAAEGAAAGKSCHPGLFRKITDSLH